MKKFELTTESITFLGSTLFRIKALISFGNVKAGELCRYWTNTYFFSGGFAVNCLL